MEVDFGLEVEYAPGITAMTWGDTVHVIGTLVPSSPLADSKLLRVAICPAPEQADAPCPTANTMVLIENKGTTFAGRKLGSVGGRPHRAPQQRLPSPHPHARGACSVQTQSTALRHDVAFALLEDIMRQHLTLDDNPNIPLILQIEETAGEFVFAAPSSANARRAPNDATSSTQSTRIAIQRSVARWCGPARGAITPFSVSSLLLLVLLLRRGSTPTPVPTPKPSPSSAAGRSAAKMAAGAAAILALLLALL